MFIILYYFVDFLYMTTLCFVTSISWKIISFCLLKTFMYSFQTIIFLTFRDQSFWVLKMEWGNAGKMSLSAYFRGQWFLVNIQGCLYILNLGSIYTTLSVIFFEPSSFFQQTLYFGIHWKAFLPIKGERANILLPIYRNFFEYRLWNFSSFF